MQCVSAACEHKVAATCEYLYIRRRASNATPRCFCARALFVIPDTAMAATSILSSTAALESQCEKVGLSADWIKALKDASVDSLSKLSYSVTLPGTAATDKDIEDFAGKLRLYWARPV